MGCGFERELFKQENLAVVTWPSTASQIPHLKSTQAAFQDDVQACNPPSPFQDEFFNGKMLVHLSKSEARSKAGGTELSLGRIADFWDSVLQSRALSSLSPSPNGKKLLPKPPVQLLCGSGTAGKQ